jgi:DNA-binding Xre family transcriptional regulator
MKSNLKEILDQRQISIRQLESMTDISFETLRRLYNDVTVQYNRDTLGTICETLNIKIDELLILIDKEQDGGK